MDATTFYRTGDGVLARSRDGGTMTPEVLHEHDRMWHAFPSLDVHTDARQIGEDDAAAMLPAGAPRSVLRGPAGSEGQGSAPLAPPGTI